jgi:uncharacterized protein YcfJ
MVRRDLNGTDGRPAMKRVIGLLGAIFGGWLGWWLGARLGLGVAVILSAVAGGAGMYAGYRWFDNYLG